jgi:nucleoside-diphosphate-sugar epimerase
VLVLPDEGEGICNAVYVDDVIDGLVLAALRPEAAGERFIVSGREPVTWATFFSAIAGALSLRPPSFWPRDDIARSIEGNHSVRLSPKNVIRSLARGPIVRGVVEGTLDLMPSRLRLRLLSYYLGKKSHRGHGQIYLPSRQALAVYVSTAVACSEKAQSKLGYKARFGFNEGMALTAQYLQWAYGNAKSMQIGAMD